MENRLLNSRRAERMILARDAAEAAGVLTECGYPALSAVTADGVEEMLAQAQEDLFRDLGGAVGEPALLDVFRCRYDYHNAKVLVKGAALGVEQDRLLMGGGRYAPARLAEEFRRDDLRGCSRLFRQGVARAREILDSTGDPQQADFALDRAYFEELSLLARQADSSFLAGYVTLLADGANLRSAVRAARLGKGADFLHQVLVGGGSVPVRAIAVTRGRELGELFRATPLADAAAAGAALSVPGSGGLVEFERHCDDAVMEYLQAGRRIPFGEQPVIGYLYAREAEITAIRIILSGRMAGLDGNVIRQRLRRTYG